jgi:hypothetical protein
MDSSSKYEVISTANCGPVLVIGRGLLSLGEEGPTFFWEPFLVH